MAKNLPKLMTDNKTKILEAQRSQGKMIPKSKRMTEKCLVIFTLITSEDENRGGSQREKVIIKEKKIIVHVSCGHVQTKRQCNDSFKEQKGKTSQLKILYPAKIVFQK